MAVYVKTLKDNNDNSIYPQTKASAVYTGDNTTVENALNEVKRNASAATRGLIKYSQGSFTIPINGFLSDSTYQDYPFRKSIVIGDCTANHFGKIAFDPNSLLSGTLAPICQTYDGGIYVYSSKQNQIQITGVYEITYNA